MKSLFAQYDDDLFAKVTIGASVFFVAFFVAYMVTLHPPYDGFGYLVGRDFLNMWMGAHAAVSGRLHDLFDFPSYVHWQRTLFPMLPEHNWSYPPHILLFIWPLAFLGYFPALALWSALGLLAWYLAAFPRATGTGQQLMFLMLAPAVTINLFAGQNGLFFSALLVAGLVNLEKRPLLAGVFFGLLTMKPQLGLLLPFALVLRGQWRCIASTIVTTAILIGATLAVFGVSVFSDYLRLVPPVQSSIMENASRLMPVMMPSAFMNIRVLMLPARIDFWAQIPFTLAAVAAVIWTFSAKRDAKISQAVLVTATFVVTPYIFNYDMVIFSWVIWNLRDRLVTENDERLALLLWTLPVSVMLLGLCQIPGSALIPAAFLLRLVWMLKSDVRVQPCIEPAYPLESNPLRPVSEAS